MSKVRQTGLFIVAIRALNLLFVSNLLLVTTSSAQIQRLAPKAKKSTTEGTEAKKSVKTAAKGTDEKKGFDPLVTKGLLTEISEPMAKLLKFKRKGEKLRFDVPGSYSEADGAFREIRTKARGGGGGHGSGTFWTQYVSGQTFGGRIQRSEQNFGGNRKPRPDSLTVEFLEAADNSSSLEVQAENSEEFVIRVNGGLVPYYLQVIQTKSEFVVQEINGDYSFAAQGNSFESFCRNNPDYVQKRLLTILKRYGFAAPITRFNSVTRDHVIALLSPADDEQMKLFKKEFQGLESKKYEEREAASKLLNKDFEKWKDVLRYAAGSDQFSIEVRSRLQKIIKEKSSEEDRQLIALVAAGDLPNDPEYLVWLLGQSQDDQQTSHIVAKLKKITQQDLGSNVNSWKEFLASKAANGGSGSETSVLTRPSLVDAIGYLPQMAEPTANLLRLTAENGKLKLNRKFWADQFNGESIKTLVTRLQTQLEKSNLPKRWLNSGGGHALDYVFHEHVLLEHIQTVIPPQMSQHYYSYGNLSSYRNSSINRKVEQPHLFLQLNRERQTTKDDFKRLSGTKNKPNVFHYTVRERRDSNMEISFVEQDDSSLFLTISSLKAQSVFHLFQAADGKVSCHLMSGGKVKSARADNFEQLYQTQKEFLEVVAYPVFTRFGIQIPKELGGPLEIKNAKRPSKKEMLGE